eukprot:CAMPEP_0119319024 /NCGR_PEP_ID=MMETSP1333-20130426/48293_1 /TAXON_ID=418940 /ORGANISM="Scyphosphaera apsteinii, Strain RCC1455" /LENGTH=249 /DNA_ID=CAMNT_0007325345 /DNA_START=182 /DNA_END=931 /DNA_ORIENTATION=+
MTNGGLARTFWQTADSGFSHINYTSYLGGEKGLMSRWKSEWLDRWAKGGWLRGKRVGDYGIGAGLLGKLLCTNYSIARYVGMDIAARQLEAAAILLESLAACPRTLILQSGTPDFSTLGLDVLISQQVIQHFPSQSYVDSWLSAVETARIPKVFLEVRYAHEARFSNWGNANHDKDSTQAEKENIIDTKQTMNAHVDTRNYDAISFAVMLNCEYILQRMPSYKLEGKWFTSKGYKRTKFQACALAQKTV